MFESDRDPAVFDRDVYVMNADGTGQRRLRTGNVNARDVDWQPTVDLRLRLRRAGTRVTATVTNLTPVATEDVVVTVRIGARRTIRLGHLDASATRSVRFTVARRIRRIEAVVSGAHADPRPADNRAILKG